MIAIFKRIAVGSLASFLISFVNFITFAVLPSYVAYMSDFAVFGEANIYSGFYNSIIATAAGSVALLTLNSKNNSHVKLYCLTSLLVTAFFLLWSGWRESELIFAYAILSVQNYSITSKRYLADKISTAYKLSFHPIMFFLSVSLQESFGFKLAWTSLYLYCAIFSFLLWRYELCMIIRKAMEFENTLDFKRLGYLLLSCSALPLLVQMDLLFIKIHGLDIAYFSVVHKIIYSIPIAIVGINIPVFVDIYEKGKREEFVMMIMIVTVAVSFLTVATLVSLNAFTDIYFDTRIILSVIFISATYSFLNLMLSVVVIIRGREMFYMVFGIILISALGYFLEEYTYFIIYKSTIFIASSVVMLKLYFSAKSHE